MYRMRAIISRRLYIFYPIFTAAYIVERLVLQKGNSSILSLKSAVYNQERVIMARVRYIVAKQKKNSLTIPIYSLFGPYYRFFSSPWYLKTLLEFDDESKNIWYVNY